MFSSFLPLISTRLIVILVVTLVVMGIGLIAGGTDDLKRSRLRPKPPVLRCLGGRVVDLIGQTAMAGD